MVSCIPSGKQQEIIGEEKVVMTKNSISSSDFLVSNHDDLLRVMIHVKDLPLNVGLAGDCSGVLS